MADEAAWAAQPEEQAREREATLQQHSERCIPHVIMPCGHQSAVVIELCLAAMAAVL